eukprot:TRINITY_DN12463_c0_g3_i1.p1 TRINITY_DN12463_c0_g3~~TRINITY_DN12463_c0_g3_i1.p1  ORF type:complete len:142 (+),score=22.36 TRINITY_DN12463_c0_g3_i1:496-921(+)
MKVHLEFIDWLRKRGVSLNLTNLVIVDRNNRELRASGNISMNEIILSIPLRVAVTPADTESSELGKAITAANFMTKDFKSTIFIALSMLKKRNEEYFAPWLNVLPDDVSNYPMFFGKEERDWLKGSSIMSIPVFNGNSCNC